MLSLEGKQFEQYPHLACKKKRNSQNIVIMGENAKQPYEKLICPVKLFTLWRRELYFVCMSEYYNQDFFIKINRIVKAELTNESFEPDPKRIKRIEDRLVKSFGMFDGNVPKVCKVTVCFPATPYYKLIFSEKKFHPSQKMSESKKDNILITLNVPIGMDLINWVLSWPDAVVVEPEELKEHMRIVARTLIKKYGK